MALARRSAAAGSRSSSSEVSIVVGTEGVSSGLSGQPLNHWGSALGSPAAFPVVSSGFEWAQVVAKRPLKPTQVVSVVAERTPPVVTVVMECAPQARSALSPLSGLSGRSVVFSGLQWSQWVIRMNWRQAKRPSVEGVRRLSDAGILFMTPDFWPLLRGQCRLSIEPRPHPSVT